MGQKNLIILLTVLLLSGTLHAKTLKIAVIDTGYDFKSTWPDAEQHGLAVPKLCPEGHKDFTTYIPIPDQKLDKESTEYKKQWANGVKAVKKSYSHEALQDTHGHGTQMAGLIAKYAKNADYCLIILKFYDPAIPSDNLANIRKSIKYATSLGVDIINMSGGGVNYDEEERLVTIKALNKGITIVAAAGNERNNIDLYKYYPAMYDSRVIVVENWRREPVFDKEGNILQTFRAPSSNYSIKAVTTDGGEFGEDVLSLYFKNSYTTNTGTSQAAAIRTGKLTKFYSDAYKFNTDLILERIKRTKNVA